MRLVRAVAMILGLAGPAVGSPCGPGARLDFPMSELFRADAAEYLFEAISAEGVPPDPDPVLPYGTAYRLTLEARAAALPAQVADLPYLIALSELAAFPDPLRSLAVMAQSTVVPELAAAADRNGLAAEAALLRRVTSLFPDWDAGPVARSAAMRDGLLSAPAERALDAGARALNAATPRILAASEALIARDPQMAATYRARLASASTERRMEYLVHRLTRDCLTDWWTPGEADAAFAGMAGPQADILLLAGFLFESYNGSVHQYFYNSSGTMAPQLAGLLDRIGLPDHAGAVRAGMAVFPGPYPRDTDARRALMERFTVAEDDALYALTVWADDGMISAAAVRLAEEAGLMPR